ncbi:MAG: Flp pilus assembly protein CpaB [Omnitrophica WOR_2 bacterium GWA2_47_8]|nr:MAG: Flp pilus assembly protein CpaB [Omnitrophica WOR_2 bacterium GWA2_47_8]
MNLNLENKRQVLIIAVAVLLGLTAALLTGNHIESSIKQQTADLAKEFKKNDAIYREEVENLKKEIQLLASRQMAVAQQQATGPAGAPSAEIPKSSLALRTPPGKRALTVLIDALSAVGGLINPGDYVDIMAHLKIPSPANLKLPEEKVTAVLFQNIQVLAVGTNLQATGGYEQQQQARSLNITLAVEPEEAGLLTFAQNNGTLQLVLRAPQETEIRMLQTASWEALSDYVLDKHGMELTIPRSRTMIQPVGTGIAPAKGDEEVKPYIQIFRSGKEL